MTPRVLRWLIFSIIFSSLPLGLDFLMALSRSQGASMPDITEIIGRGELCLLAVTLSAVGAGEIGGAQLKKETTGIVLTGASYLNAIVSTALYVMMKSTAKPIIVYIVLSIVVFLSTLFVATNCISATEKANV